MTDLATKEEVDEYLRLLPWYRYASRWPDPERAEAVWLQATTMLALWDVCLVGNPAPRVKEMSDRMSHPEIGDLVLEITTVWHPDWPERALGRLVDREGDKGYGEIFHVESSYYADKPITTWDNARFIALPIDESQYLATPGRVVLTRDSLLAGLADAGFELTGT